MSSKYACPDFLTIRPSIHILFSYYNDDAPEEYPLTGVRETKPPAGSFVRSDSGEGRREGWAGDAWRAASSPASLLRGEPVTASSDTCPRPPANQGEEAQAV